MCPQEFLEMPVMGMGIHAQKLLHTQEKSQTMLEMLQDNSDANHDTETG